MFVSYSDEEVAEFLKAEAKPKSIIKHEPVSVVDEKTSDTSRSIPKLDLKSLAKSGSILRYEKGTILFKQGDEGSDMFLLLSGSVSVTDERGLVANLYAGDMFGEMSLIDSLPRSATVKVQDTIDVLRLTRENFCDIVKREPAIAFRVMQTLSKRVRLSNQQIFMLKNRDNFELQI